MFKVPVVAALAATLFAGPASAAGQHYTVTASDPKGGSVVEVPNGDKLMLQPTACEDCGSRWKILAKPNATVMAYDTQLASVHKGKCASPCVGGYVYERFRFLSKTVGTATVKFGYFTNNSTKPTKTLSLELDVVS